MGRRLAIGVLPSSIQPSSSPAYERNATVASDGTLVIDDAALYKSLHRLEEQGAIASEWGVSENNRRARYYRLTAEGRKQLRAEHSAWNEYARAITRILRTA